MYPYLRSALFTSFFYSSLSVIAKSDSSKCSSAFGLRGCLLRGSYLNFLQAKSFSTTPIFLHSTFSLSGESLPLRQYEQEGDISFLLSSCFTLITTFIIAYFFLSINLENHNYTHKHKNNEGGGGKGKARCTNSRGVGKNLCFNRKNQQ